MSRITKSWNRRNGNLTTNSWGKGGETKPVPSKFQNWSAPSALLAGEKFSQTGGFSNFSPKRVACEPFTGNKSKVDLLVWTVTGGLILGA